MKTMPFHRRIRAYSGYPALLPLLVCLLLGGRLPGQAHLARIDEALAAVFGEAGREASYSERLQLIHSLPSDLDGGRLERCRRFLESPTELQALPCLEFNGLKNDMVLALLRQKEGLPELAGLLVRMSRDPWTDDVWRDYCVQFLGKCYPAVADMDSRRSMAAALWEALETRRASSCAGAAGRQLMSLSRSFREFPPGDVSRAALEALRAPECSDGSRCALLQVCAVLGDTAALPDARALASSEGTPSGVRASAIAAIGMLGDASDLPLLDRLAAGADSLAIPARAAIVRLRAEADAPP